MSPFLEGALMMANAVVALFFLRFWRRTGDRLFAMFSLSFSLMAVVRLIHAFWHVASEHAHYVYVIRLLAYALIVYGIVEKNRSPEAARRAEPEGPNGR